MRQVGRRAGSLLLAGVLLFLCIAGVQGAGISALTREYTPAEGSFTLCEDSRFYLICDGVPEEDLLRTLSLLSQEFAAQSLPGETPLPVCWGEARFSRTGDLCLELTESLQVEEYQVEIGPTQIRIRASHATGLLYGTRMLLKHFLCAGETSLPACSFSHSPDTKERGLMLDCARKYWSVEWICNLLGQMSWLGYNTLSLHLGEDQGIRADIWSEGPDCNGNDFSWLIGYDSNWNTAYPDPNGEKFYTAAELRQIADCAARYHIALLPDYDVPPHCDVMTARYAAHVASNPDYSFSYKGVRYSAAGTEQGGTSLAYDTKSYPNTDFFRIQVKSSRKTVDVSNPVARAFSLAVVEAYGVFFRSLGCTDFQLGCDELSVEPTDGWEAYAQNHVPGGSTALDALTDYINEAAAMLKGLGYSSVRVFNDVLYGENRNIPLDGEIGLHVWNLQEQGEVESYLADHRKLYNCLQNYCYYVLRSNTAGGDARSPDNYWWAFHHSTPERIYEEWNPGRMHSYDTSGALLPRETVAGGYFLIWGDFGGYRTQEQVWYGEDLTGQYNLIDRLWANSAKMLQWELQTLLDYGEFTAIREKLRYYPGFTHCTQLPALPAAPVPAAAVTGDHSRLYGLLQETVENEQERYTFESYEAYTAALLAARETDSDPEAEQAALDEAAQALETAQAALEPNEAELTILVLDGEGNRLDTLYARRNFGAFFLLRLPDYGDGSLVSEQEEVLCLPLGTGYRLLGFASERQILRLRLLP